MSGPCPLGTHRLLRETHESPSLPVLSAVKTGSATGCWGLVWGVTQLPQQKKTALQWIPMAKLDLRGWSIKQQSQVTQYLSQSPQGPLLPLSVLIHNLIPISPARLQTSVYTCDSKLSPGSQAESCVLVLVLPFLYPLLHESLQHKSRSGSLPLTVGPTVSLRCLLKTQNLSHLYAHSSLRGSAFHPTSTPSRPSLPPLQLQ